MYMGDLMTAMQRNSQWTFSSYYLYNEQLGITRL